MGPDDNNKKKKDNRGVKLGTKRGKYKKRNEVERENIRFLDRMSRITNGEFQVKVLELLEMAKKQLPSEKKKEI